jgi:hypothetical protein
VNTQRADSRTTERRKKPRKVWAVKKDRGAAVLEWKADRRNSERREADDPLARTYNFLQKLTVPGLALEDDTPRSRAERNPYDSSRGFKKPGGGK